MSYPAVAYRGVPGPRGGGFQYPPARRVPNPAAVFNARTPLPLPAMARGAKFALGRIFWPIGAALLAYELYQLWSKHQGYIITDCGFPHTHFRTGFWSCLGTFTDADVIANPPVAGTHYSALQDVPGAFMRVVQRFQHQPGVTPALIPNGNNRTAPRPELPPVPEFWPAIDPLQLPIGVPVPRPLPLPWHVIPLRPWRNPWRDPGEQPSHGPEPKPRPRPRPRPEVVWPLVPAARPAIRPNTHRWAKPPSRVKENKTRASSGVIRALMPILNGITEVGDIVDALWKALPKKYRSKCVTMQCKAADLYRHWDKVEVTDALRELVKNELEDAFFGKLGAAGKAAAGANPYGGLTGFQTGPYDNYYSRQAPGASGIEEGFDALWAWAFSG